MAACFRQKIFLRHIAPGESRACGMKFGADRAALGRAVSDDGIITNAATLCAPIVLQA